MVASSGQVSSNQTHSYHQPPKQKRKMQCGHFINEKQGLPDDLAVEINILWCVCSLCDIQSKAAIKTAAIFASFGKHVHTDKHNTHTQVTSYRKKIFKRSYYWVLSGGAGPPCATNSLYIFFLISRIGPWAGNVRRELNKNNVVKINSEKVSFHTLVLMTLNLHLGCIWYQLWGQLGRNWAGLLSGCGWICKTVPAKKHPKCSAQSKHCTGRQYWGG